MFFTKSLKLTSFITFTVMYMGLEGIQTCHCCDLSMASIRSKLVCYFTRVFSSGFFVAFMQTLQDTGVSNHFSVVSVWGIELLVILVPSDKHFGGPSESALKSQFLAHWDENVLQLCHKACWVWERIVIIINYILPPRSQVLESLRLNVEKRGRVSAITFPDTDLPLQWL